MRNASAPFADFIPPFLAPGRGLGEKSRRDYARYLREFDAFTGHTDLRTALTLENGKRFRERLKERGRSASRNGTMYLKSFAHWVADTEVLARPDGGSIYDALKAPKTPKTKRQALTEEDLDAIWAVLADRPKRERYRAIAFVRLVRRNRGAAHCRCLCPVQRRRGALACPACGAGRAWRLSRGRTDP